jgi:acyl carrier protein
MTRDEILKQTQDVFREVFDDESLLITDETTAEDIEDWDSLEHINLITAIEQHFKIKFAMSEATRFKNVGDLIDTTYKKVS